MIYYIHIKFMKDKNTLTPLNNYCEHSHNMSKSTNVYNSKMYKELTRCLDGEFLSLENQAFFNYEKWLTK